MSRIYLDWNATTPPLDEVVEAMARTAKDAWANPASVHGDGRRARGAVEDARAAVGELAGVDPRDVTLTSGGTEANNLALRSAFAPGAKRRGAAGGAAPPSSSAPGVLVTSRLEHPSVTRVAEALEREGRARVRWLRVLSTGTIDLDDLARALDEDADVRLVAVQAVNHETGVIQPIARVIELAVGARGGPVPVHVDAVQAYGRLDTSALGGATTQSLAAHKIRGPKGIGALVATCGFRVEPVLLGGAQEKGVRPGTVDPVAASGFAVAARHAKTGASRYTAVAQVRDAFTARLAAIWPTALVHGEDAPRAPHVANVAFPGWEGAELAAALDLEGISVSSGSACSAGTHEPSPVLEAMFDRARARSAIRVSFGETSSLADAERAAEALSRVLHRVG